MEKPRVLKLWKEVHKRKDSEDSLNDSMHSNKSSLSAGYNKFQFKRNEENHKNSAVFHFVSKNKEPPRELLSNHKEMKERQASRKTLGAQESPRRLLSLDSIVKKMHNFGFEKDTPAEMKRIAEDIKSIITTLKSTLSYFDRQIKDLRSEWETAMKALLRKEMYFQNNTLWELKSRMEDKQKELDKLSKESSFAERHIFADSKAEPIQIHHFEGNLERMTFSAIEMSQPNQRLQTLSRKTTIQSLMGGQSFTSPVVKKEKPVSQLSSLRQAMRRMKQTLDSKG